MADTEINLAQLKEYKAGEYQLIDIRNEDAFRYGSIKGAVNLPEQEIFLRKEELSAAKRLILFCAKGINSIGVAERLREEGFDAVSLEGGYGAYLMDSFQKKTSEKEERCQEIEKSIRKKFHKAIFSKFAKAINEYELLQPGDKVAVCISGGKDSMLMAKLFQELQRHNKFQFELVFLVMDPGYSEMNRKVIERNAELMQIPITVFETQIFDAVYEIENSPCYLCARMRRGYLYSKAKELGCNKIALGHHFDDVIETTLIGMFYASQLKAMIPKLHSTNFEGMELIRPMYCIHEEDIIAWMNYNGLEFIQCACRFTENYTLNNNEGGMSKRQEIKMLIRQLKKDNPLIDKSIFNSIHAVSLDTMPGYKTHGKTYSFLDNYYNNERSEEQL